MGSDRRREGDDRPFRKAAGVPLNLHPAHDEPFRWLPRQGEPSCIGEWLSQQTIRLVAWLPIYIALIVTLIIVIQVVHPLGLGR
jgi:hypothetical protein